MRRVLLTGGAGFIGSNLVRRLVRLGQHVTVLDKLTYAGNLESLQSVHTSPLFRFVQGDIGNTSLVRQLLQDCTPDAVYHLAAESHVDRSIDGPAAFLETNVWGTFRLLEACLAYWRELDSAGQSKFRFLHVSTDEVYGSLGSEGKFSEETPYAPNSPYSASKASSDHFVRAYHHTFGFPTLTTNCSNNYGPYQYPEKLIPLMTLNAKEGRPLPVYGTGGNVRDWLHVEDHCAALVKVCEHGRLGETYNIGGNCERTNLQIVHAICDLMDERMPRAESTRSLIQFVKDRPGHDLRYAIDSRKIERELGWTPSRNFEQGLAETVDWYLSNDDWVQGRASAGIHRERLGLERKSVVGV